VPRAERVSYNARVQAAGGGWRSICAKSGSIAAQLGAEEIQIVADGFAISGLSRVPNPYEDKMRSRFGFAEEMRAARGAKLAMHLVSAIGCRWIVAQFAGYFECGGRKCITHCRPARADFLAVSAPAHTCGDWLCTDLIVHVPAQTST
jgi:hypothetical protein